MSEINENRISFKEAWIKTHKRHLPVILGITGFVLLLDIGLHLFVSGIPKYEFHLEELIVLMDISLLPLMAVNTIFIAQRIFGEALYSSWKAVILKVLLAVVGVMLMSMFLEYVLYASWGYEDDDYFILGDYRADTSTTNVIEYSLAAFFIGIPIFIWQHRVRGLNVKLKKKELEEERLIQLKTQAELHALQSRINPHFLFNSFNSIASLISIDPEKAEKMMVDLAELFRYSLNSEESNFVQIQEELKIAETYLSIEKTRFGDNLKYEINCPAELNTTLVPRFLIQPLVENAVKHATSKVKKGELRLVLKEEDGDLHVYVYDNGPAFPIDLEKGYGLQSTYDKLELLYPNQHGISFINHPEKHIHLYMKKGKEDGQKV